MKIIDGVKAYLGVVLAQVVGLVVLGFVLFGIAIISHFI